MTPRDKHFIAGRDVAVRMLRHMQNGGDADVCSIEAKYRDGAPQNNVAQSYLLQIMQRPELLEGFAAVISDAFNGGTFCDADVYAQLSIGEMRGPKHDPAFQAIITKMVGNV